MVFMGKYAAPILSGHGTNLPLLLIHKNSYADMGYVAVRDTQESKDTTTDSCHSNTEGQ